MYMLLVIACMKCLDARQNDSHRCIGPFVEFKLCLAGIPRPNILISCERVMTGRLQRIQHISLTICLSSQFSSLCRNTPQYKTKSCSLCQSHAHYVKYFPTRLSYQPLHQARAQVMIHTISLTISSACDVIISPLCVHKNGRCDDISDLLYFSPALRDTSMYMSFIFRVSE